MHIICNSLSLLLIARENEGNYLLVITHGRYYTSTLFTTKHIIQEEKKILNRYRTQLLLEHLRKTI